MRSRLLVLLAFSSATAAPALAQERAQGLVRPITAPVKYAGVYHLGTGTWTRAGAIESGGSMPASSTGPGIIYDNTCYIGYFMPTPTGAIFIDEGRLPSTSSPVLPNPWGPGHASEVGTQDSYTIDGFQIAYCTSEGGSRTYALNFYEAYDRCSVAPATPTAGFTLSGLPASATAGIQACWKVDIDLCASSQSFSMQADADRIYDGLATGVHDTFGWSFQLLSAAPHARDGFLWAGSDSYYNYDCSSSDGTVFDTGTSSPIYPASSDAINLGCGSLAAGSAPEEGCGMGIQDRWRMENYPGYQDGCYYFGSGPGSFYLQLYSADVALPNVGPALPFCDPGTAGVIACPCLNPPAGSGRGCNNSAATGGASITSTGSASLANDTLAFTTAAQRPSGTTILLQGASPLAAGVSFGQGVRCVGGTLRRLFVKMASGGSITAPGPGDPTISARSAALGDVISAGTQRYYAAYYRDPIVLGGCNAFFTFNITNAGAVLWN
jgi:hypothetical protein